MVLSKNYLQNTLIPEWFERLCMALQGKTSNYDTDVFTLIEKVEQITGLKYTAKFKYYRRTE
jgi:alanyl-tRNA synthetase